MKKQLKWPNFKDDNTVGKWLDSTDFSEYLESSDLKPFDIEKLLKNTKPKTRKMTIRIPEKWIVQAKAAANQLDIPYQSLLKQLIHQGLQKFEVK